MNIFRGELTDISAKTRSTGSVVPVLLHFEWRKMLESIFLCHKIIWIFSSIIAQDPLTNTDVSMLSRVIERDRNLHLLWVIYLYFLYG